MKTATERVIVGTIIGFILGAAICSFFNPYDATQETVNNAYNAGRESAINNKISAKEIIYKKCTDAGGVVLSDTSGQDYICMTAGAREYYWNVSQDAWVRKGFEKLN